MSGYNIPNWPDLNGIHRFSLLAPIYLLRRALALPTRLTRVFALAPTLRAMVTSPRPSYGGESAASLQYYVHVYRVK